jgi:GNAT superfamily N-acetyltransferase
MVFRAIAMDIGGLARRDGLRPTVRKLVRAYSPSELLVIVKDLAAIQPITFEPRLAVADLGREALPELADFNRRRCDRRATERFASDLARGYRGFVAREGGAVAGYYWWADRAHPHLERLGVTLADRDVYGFDFFLAPEHRGDGRATEFLHAIESRLRARGFGRLWGYVRADNRPARWLYSARGYEVVGKGHLRIR